jgi:hypothetical protein
MVYFMKKLIYAFLLSSSITVEAATPRCSEIVLSVPQWDNSVTVNIKSGGNETLLSSSSLQISNSDYGLSYEEQRSGDRSDINLRCLRFDNPEGKLVLTGELQVLVTFSGEKESKCPETLVSLSEGIVISKSAGPAHFFSLKAQGRFGIVPLRAEREFKVGEQDFTAGNYFITKASVVPMVQFGSFDMSFLGNEYMLIENRKALVDALNECRAYHVRGSLSRSVIDQWVNSLSQVTYDNQKLVDLHSAIREMELVIRSVGILEERLLHHLACQMYYLFNNSVDGVNGQRLVEGDILSEYIEELGRTASQEEVNLVIEQVMNQVRYNELLAKRPERLAQLP